MYTLVLLQNISLTLLFIYILNASPREDKVEAPREVLKDADLDSEWDKAIETYDEMGLPGELLRGINSYGFENPSPIEQRAIKPIIMGRDLIVQAQFGMVSVREHLQNASSGSA